MNWYDTSLSISEIWIGHKSGTYGFDGGQVQLKVSGSGSFTVSGQTICDQVAFSFDENADLVLAFYGTSGYFGATSNESYGYDLYWKSGNDASNASPSGYTHSGAAGACVLIEELTT